LSYKECREEKSAVRRLPSTTKRDFHGLSIMPAIDLSPVEVRRLAVAAQRLAGPRPPATIQGALDLFSSLHCVQIDPIRAVERTQLLVLWSRLGPFDPAILEHLQKEERLIFEDWAHCASFVRMHDYPIFNFLIEQRRHKNTDHSARVREWMVANQDLRAYVLDRLQAEGPLTTGNFEDLAAVPWGPSGWSDGRSVARMLDFLDSRGELMVVGRKGNQKEWHLRDSWLPAWVDRSLPPVEEVVRDAAQKSLKALGVATPKQISNHFIRGAYPNLARRLAELEQEGTILPVQITDEGQVWPGEWYLHQESLSLLEALRNGNWRPRTVLLSPFDNLICHRERTEQIFDFHFRIEIYVPRQKRQYGYYVLPILHGERLIGRMDSKMDRKSATYQIHALYPEDPKDVTPETGQAIAETVRELMLFLGAKKISLGEAIPDPWRRALEA
jgi:uncharacterized protein